MKIRAKTVTTTERIIEGEISGEELLESLLRQLQLPSGAVVHFYMDVPGGGDWSNTELQVQPDQPLRFRAVSGEQREESGPPEPAPVPPSPPMPRPPGHAATASGRSPMPSCEWPGCRRFAISGQRCLVHQEPAAVPEPEIEPLI
jgi:hypothetical protein